LERAARIANLPPNYHSPVSDQDRRILDKSIEELVQDVHKQILQPIDILRTYGKVAVKAHERTNCLTEVMIPEAEIWAEHEINRKGPLAGIPVSLKDSIAVGGFDVSVGYSCNTGKPYAKDGPVAKLLKDAGESYTFMFIAVMARAHVHQVPYPTSKPTSLSLYSPSSRRMMYGDAAQIRTIPNTPQAAQLAERALC